MQLYDHIIEVRSVNIPYYYIQNEQIMFTNTFYTFQRYILNILFTTKWFVEINDVLLQYVAINC